MRRHDPHKWTVPGGVLTLAMLAALTVTAPTPAESGHLSGEKSGLRATFPSGIGPDVRLSSDPAIVQISTPSAGCSATLLGDAKGALSEIFTTAQHCIAGGGRGAMSVLGMAGRFQFSCVGPPRGMGSGQVGGDDYAVCRIDAGDFTRLKSRFPPGRAKCLASDYPRRNQRVKNVGYGGQGDRQNTVVLAVHQLTMGGALRAVDPERRGNQNWPGDSGGALLDADDDRIIHGATSGYGHTLSYHAGYGWVRGPTTCTYASFAAPGFRAFLPRALQALRYSGELCRGGRGSASPKASPKPSPTKSPTEAPAPERKKPAEGDGAALPKADRDVIEHYEKQMRYVSGTPRERFPEEMFRDIPKGGTGKLVFAYFDSRTDEALEAMAKDNPLVEVRRYAPGSPEHLHAKLFDAFALALDGLGRKISRYAPVANGRGTGIETRAKALRLFLADSPEQELLRRYLAAKARGKPVPEKPGVTPTTAPTPTPTPEAAPDTPPEEAPSRPKSTFDPTKLGSFLESHCVDCHRKHTPFPKFTASWSGWKELLDKGDADAHRWLGRFSAKIAAMLEKVKLNAHEEPGKGVHDFIKEQHRRYAKPTESDSRKPGASHATRMIDPKKLAEYEEALKSANVDSGVKEDLMTYDAMWDETGNPPWSFAPHGGDSGRKGPRPVDREPASPVLPHLFKRVGGQWRWKEPYDGGFTVDSASRDLKKFVVVRFPRDKSGKLIKGIRGTEERWRAVSRSSANGYSTYTPDPNDLRIPWASFPAGTKIFEVHYSTKLGRVLPVDILAREKRVFADGKTAFWAADAYRQDSSRKRIREWVERQTDAKTNPDHAKILAALEKPESDAVKSELGIHGEGVPFIVDGRRTGTIPAKRSVLEGVKTETLLKMYRELPMESSAGSDGWALEPRGLFSGAHRGIRIDSNTCANCHRRAGESFQDVFEEAGLPTSGVIAYGNAPGYDGVLSAPWYTRADLDRYGSSSGRSAFPQAMRPEWGKFFEDYRPERHPPSIYRRTEDLQVATVPSGAGATPDPGTLRSVGRSWAPGAR